MVVEQISEARPISTATGCYIGVIKLSYNLKLFVNA